MDRPKVDNISCVILYFGWFNRSDCKFVDSSLCELILAKYDVFLSFSNRKRLALRINRPKINLKWLGCHDMTFIFHLIHRYTIQYSSIILSTAVYVKCISWSVERGRRNQVIIDVSLTCQELHIICQRHISWINYFDAAIWINWKVQSEINSPSR